MTLDLVPTIALRAPQRAGIDAFRASPLQRKIVSLPMALGKTLMGLMLAQELNVRTLWLAHTDELVSQPVEAAKTNFPSLGSWLQGRPRIGVVKAGRDEYDANVVFGSVQTLRHEGRLGNILMTGNLGLVVVDEAHRSAAKSYRKILERCGAFKHDGPQVLGLTATIERSDSQTLFPIFEDVVYHYSIQQAIEDGYLVQPITINAPLADVDLSSVRIGKNGDLSEEDLEREFDKAKAAVGTAKAIVEHARDSKTIVFTVSVNQAHRTAAELKNLGIRAEAIWGEMAKGRRRSILKAFGTGEVQAIANANCLNEGYNEPSIDCVVWAKPTLSKLVFTQGIGRGLRTHPGKKYCKVIDMVGASTLGLVTADRLLKEDGSSGGHWGGGGGGSSKDGEHELVRSYLRSAWRDPIKVGETYFAELKQGVSLVSVSANARPWFINRKDTGWVLSNEGREISSVLSQGEVMYVCSQVIHEDGGPAAPKSQAWERFFSGYKENETVSEKEVRQEG